MPKNLVLIGTAASWYFGIVATDQDLAFTASNIVAHGIPYMGLIWLVQGRGPEVGFGQGGEAGGPRRLSGWGGLLLFLGILWLCAYVEEGLWDGWVWREHGSLFPLFARLSPVDEALLLKWLVPTLALPQIAHYLHDGFIWKLRRKGRP